MKNFEFIKYIVLVLGILVFFTLIFILAKDHILGDNIQESSDPQAVQSIEEDNEYVSDVFDDTGFGNQFNELDPFEKYCEGNEGAINTFTVCSRQE